MMTKAVRIHGKMDLRLEEIELPEVGDDDGRVKSISDSICMSTYTRPARASPSSRRTSTRARSSLPAIPISIAAATRSTAWCRSRRC